MAMSHTSKKILIRYQDTQQVVDEIKTNGLATALAFFKDGQRLAALSE